MQGLLLAEFQGRRFAIQARWDALLRVEPVTSPLANPESLVHLIDSTIEDVWRALHAGASASGASSASPPPPKCLCGRNPFLAFFAAGRQAMREGLILSQATLAPLDPPQRDRSLAELEAVLDKVSRREIETFCGVCQFRNALIASPAFAATAR